MSGLEERYYVERLDKPEKNDGRRLFVLDPTGDPIAEAALRQYAEFTPNEQLRQDIYDWVGTCPINGNRPHAAHTYVDIGIGGEQHVRCEGVKYE